MIKIKDCAFQDGSYPCGYKEGKLPDCELCHKIRKASIKEVVEWINSCKMNTDVYQEDGSLFLSVGDIAILKEYWQSKLKEMENDVV